MGLESGFTRGGAARPSPSSDNKNAPGPFTRLVNGFNAGWSSPVARQAHNLKVVGSNPTPATKHQNNNILKNNDI